VARSKRQREARVEAEAEHVQETPPFGFVVPLVMVVLVIAIVWFLKTNR
jgi:hypothetical protein